MQWKVGCIVISCTFIGRDSAHDSRNDHTIMTAPLPVCSAKLSMIWLGQYYGGGPRWNPQCCSFAILMVGLPVCDILVLHLYTSWFCLYRMNFIFLVKKLLLIFVQMGCHGWARVGMGGHRWAWVGSQSPTGGHGWAQAFYNCPRVVGGGIGLKYLI